MNNWIESYRLQWTIDISMTNHRQTTNDSYHLAYASFGRRSFFYFYAYSCENLVEPKKERNLVDTPPEVFSLGCGSTYSPEKREGM